MPNQVSLSQPEENSYYIVTSNGEEILQLKSIYDEGNFGRIDLLAGDNRFNEYISEDNGINSTPETFFANTLKPQIIDNTVPVYSGGRFHRWEEQEQLYSTVARSNESILTSRGATKTKNINADQQELDTLTHQRTQNGQPQEIFTNVYGKVETLEQFEEIKSLYDTHSEETWIETVFDFSGLSSLLVGLHGSFSIGETFDDAVREFQSTRELRRIFSQLEETIDSLHGEGAYANARVDGTSDSNLTQYGRNFFIRPQLAGNARADRDADDFGAIVEDFVYLSRPMGIDRETNISLTKAWTTGRQDSSFIVTPQDDLEFLQNTIKPQARKNVIDHHTNQAISGEMPNDADLVPPNFYKMPMRVLVTQVYGINSTQAREVYCKVVPPKYIRDISKSETIQTRIESLNVSLTNLAQKYISFISAVKDNQAVRVSQSRLDEEDRFTFSSIRNNSIPDYEKLPEFSTDFTRNHSDNINAPNLGVFGVEQYCSIERIYSDVFRSEANPDNPFSTWNSREELDELFRDRGYLLVEPSSSKLIKQFV